MTKFAIASEFADRVQRNEPMSRHTSWHVGGPADAWFTPRDVEDLSAVLRSLPAEVPVTWVGLGSNLLVRDGGVRGTVVLLHAALNELGFDGSRIRAEAGVASPKVSRFAAMHDRADAEFLSGIPGTIGGALAMNAGCYGGETWRDVVEVEVLTRQGAFERRPPEAYVIGYRSVVGRRGADDIAFTAAWFDFPPGNGAYARGRIKALLTQRIATQPLGLPNAGSVFRNPEGDHAARLIESCGLKGYAIGGARVSEKHANFIVNAEGVATAADVEALIGHVRAVVRRETGVDLEQEVRIIGEAR
jgi:UDP-N-acetylmuramate dehydrogenase